MASKVFEAYKDDPNWTVYQGVPDHKVVRQLAQLAGTFAAEAYVIQRRLRENKLDVAFFKLNSKTD